MPFAILFLLDLTLANPSQPGLPLGEGVLLQMGSPDNKIHMWLHQQWVSISKIRSSNTQHDLLNAAVYAALCHALACSEKRQATSGE